MKEEEIKKMLEDSRGSLDKLYSELDGSIKDELLRAKRKALDMV